MTDLRSEWPDWMKRAQGGDRTAYNRLLKAVVPVIRAIVRRKIDDATLIEDVVQDTLLTIHRVRDTYDPARPILPWISAIATSRAIDALRKRGRQRGREVHDDAAMLAHADEAPSPDSAGHAYAVKGLLDSLPDRQRDMVEMVHLREMSLNEAAQRSRMSIAAVKSLLHRALVRLRQTRPDLNGADDHG